jgi:hypothetical protein
VTLEGAEPQLQELAEPRRPYAQKVSETSYGNGRPRGTAVIRVPVVQQAKDAGQRLVCESFARDVKRLAAHHKKVAQRQSLAGAPGQRSQCAHLQCHDSVHVCVQAVHQAQVVDAGSSAVLWG